MPGQTFGKLTHNVKHGSSVRIKPWNTPCFRKVQVRQAWRHLAVGGGGEIPARWRLQPGHWFWTGSTPCIVDITLTVLTPYIVDITLTGSTPCVVDITFWNMKFDISPDYNSKKHTNLPCDMYHRKSTICRSMRLPLNTAWFCQILSKIVSHVYLTRVDILHWHKTCLVIIEPFYVVDRRYRFIEFNLVLNVLCWNLTN